MHKGVVGIVIGAALLAVTALVVAGCGGGGGGSTAALTKAQYVKQANAICEKGAQEREAAVNELAEEIKPGADVGELPKNRLVEVVVDPLANMVDELAALPAPEGDENQLEPMVEGYERAVGEIEENEEAAFSSEVFKDPDATALKYGLENCVL